jgi:hypothetical protein
MTNNVLVMIGLGTFFAIGVVLVGGGSYMLVINDKQYEGKATARIVSSKYIGDCLYTYEFSVDLMNYSGSYVANDACMKSIKSVKIAYDTKNPTRNRAMIFGSYPPRKLEGMEIAGACLIAMGSIVVIFISACITACLIPTSNPKVTTASV